MTDILSSKTENADYFIQVVNQITKTTFLKKWASRANIEEKPR